MRITSTIGAATVVHDGETYTADDNGIVEVPERVGEELTGFPIWLPEHEAAALVAAEQAAADNDVARLSARVAELEAWRASLESDEDEPGEDSEPAAPRRRRKPSAEQTAPTE